MSEFDTSTKLAQFNEFFSIKEKFNINISLIADEHVSYQDFIDKMPMPFKMASDIMHLDQAALRPLQTLGSVAGQLVDYLNHQAQKIDLLVNYIISQQDVDQCRYQGNSFGGGGISFTNNQALKRGQLIELKIFLLNNNCAIYCCGEIIEVSEQNDEKDQTFVNKVIFHHIREVDRESLVRCSLQQQSKQLQILAEERNKASKGTN